MRILSSRILIYLAIAMVCGSCSSASLAVQPTPSATEANAPSQQVATLNATDEPSQQAAKPGGKLIYLTANSLHLLDLSNGKQQTLSAASTYLQASGTGQYLSLTPDGKTLLFNGYDPLIGCSTWRPVYVCEETGPNGFFTYDLSNDAVNLIRPYTLSNISLSPDGSQLAFTVLEFDTTDYQVHLKLSPTTGGEPGALSTGHVVDTYPSWSPDGKWIAFLRTPSPNPKADPCTPQPGDFDTCTSPLPALYVVHPDETGLVKLLEAVRLFNSPYNQPAWSPDSQTLAVVSGQPEAHISLVSLSNDKVKQIKQFSPISGTPVWSPDGNVLAFTAAGKNSKQIVLYDIQDQSTRILTNGSLPVWSPDGKWLAYIKTSRAGKNSLALIRLDGQTLIDPGIANVGTEPLWVK